MSLSKGTHARRIGFIVFIILIVLLILEFLVAQLTVPRWLIILFGAAQAAVILWEYMHISRLVRENPESDPNVPGQ